MWDTKIRQTLRQFRLYRGINNGSQPQHYMRFLKGIQEVIRIYKLQERLPLGSVVAKKIDEYHYIKIVLP
jgi:hypothetical protein